MSINHNEFVLKSAIVESKKMTIEEFYALLESHDWYCHFSDSEQAAKAGRQSLLLLNKIASHHPLFKSLLEQFDAHMFSGDAWNTQQTEKPILKDDERDVFVHIDMPIVSDKGILIQDSNDCCNQVWDKTDSIDNNCIVKEVSGRQRYVGVFPSRDIAVLVAFYATSLNGGYSDCVVENVECFSSFDEWL